MYRQTGSGFQEEWTRRHFVATGSLQYSRIISDWDRSPPLRLRNIR
jgi:hypothetical protein